MLEQLLEAGKIHKQEYDVFVLFELTDAGRSWFGRMLIDTFMDQAPPPAFSPDLTMFADGRRSIFRDIYSTVTRIKSLLAKEATDDAG